MVNASLYCNGVIQNDMVKATYKNLATKVGYTHHFPGSQYSNKQHTIAIKQEGVNVWDTLCVCGEDASITK